MELITDEKVLKVLIGYNPWWQSGHISKDFTKPVRRLAFYEARKVFEHPTIRREVILSGPRRVGKTTIMYQMIEEYLQDENIKPKNILYVSFDHPIIKLCDIGRVMETFINNIATDENLYLFFDEIQYAKDWNGWLKTLYDNHPNYRIMATGSASPILAQGMQESGVGRWTQIRIPTLSFYEYIELMGIPKPELSAEIKPTMLSSLKPEQLTKLMVSLYPLQAHFHQYLLVGGFPEVALSKDIPYAQKIIREDVVDKVLKRDMVSLFNIRNVDHFERIFLFLCMNSGNLIEQQTLATEIGTSRQTVANYMELLEQGNLIYISHSVEQSGKKILKTKPKVYMADAAIRNAVLMQGEDILTDPDEMGMIIETAVFKHIHSFTYPEHPHVGYYRHSRTQKEIDVVVSFPLYQMVMEVKYRGNPTIKAEEAIVEWANDPARKVKAAIVITKNSDDYGVVAHATATPIIKVPAYAFLYLLGHAEYSRYQGKG